MQGKNRCCPFRNWHSGKIWSHHLQDQYHILCVVRASKPSIQRIYVLICVLTYSMYYLRHHKYKWNSIHSECTMYLAFISFTIYLVQMQISSTRYSRHYLLYKTTRLNLHLKHNFILKDEASYHVDEIYISTHFDAWCCLFHVWNNHEFQRSPCGQKKYDVQCKSLWITDIWYLSVFIKDTHKNIVVLLSFSINIFS